MQTTTTKHSAGEIIKKSGTSKLGVGIDLGTSNSSIAVGGESIDVLPIPQLSSPGTVVERSTLPSALYLPLPNELADEVMTLAPWKSSHCFALGLWARERGAQVPERLVSSAKSWLCHAEIDRNSPILPWKSEITEGKLSPIRASQYFLEHLRNAFELHQAREKSHLKLSDTEVVLTVPASFDEVARQLTVEAARGADIGKLTLLEEPQAAFYAWISSRREDWRKQVKPGDIILVVDVGGGTTDFSLIAVSESQGDLQLERVSVGDHLLLGGDNMDLALAYLLKSKMEAEGLKLDRWQFLSLVHTARHAKEKLLGDDAPVSVPIAIAGRGSSLFKKTITSELTRDEVIRVTVDGFFPQVSIHELPLARKSTGIQEYGLPFVSDPAVTRHLARFLVRSLENVVSDETLKSIVRINGEETFLQPSLVLFNGGVFSSAILRSRVMEVVRSWAVENHPEELSGTEYDLAVAKGAAYYARILAEGKGIRIKAGTARSYYLGLESSQPAVPGFTPPIQGLCIVPQGSEEGSHLSLKDREFGLITGEPVEFRFFSSAIRAGDSPGTLVEDASELDETSRLEITLPVAEGRKPGESVPVTLDCSVTEVGTLELFFKHAHSNQKWNLEFNVRAPK